MNKKITLPFLLAFCLVTSFINAQISCDYSLKLLDRFGDSWNGAAILLTINEEDPQAFFMTEEDGTEATFPFIVTEGDSFQIEYFPGSFDSEVAYSVIDAEGNEIFMDGPNPTVGMVFDTLAFCPACPATPISEIVLKDVRAEYAEITWLATDPNGSYLIKYDTAGFNPEIMGQTLVANGNNTRINGLTENTAYEFYISSACANGDTSLMTGPVFFQTVYKNDVGIVAIPSPQSECGLMSSEKIEVTLKNFGATPQTLIPFDYSVNGVPGGVSMPFDGVFTGVLGKDSTFTIEFDMQAAVGEPDRYVIKAWTALEEDSDLSNDTTTVTVLSLPLVENYPYFTDFEGDFDGWRVDEMVSMNSSWELGTPNFGLLRRAAGGSNAWVTNLDSTYNNDELSYLTSPCFNFSTLTEDPVLSFSFFLSAEACCDEAWVEVSLNGGENWGKVNTSTDARNWYNDTTNEWWDGDGNTTNGFDPEWLNASNVLVGAAGASDVRVRFVFSSDFSTNQDGMGIDNIFISPPLQNDLAGVTVNNTSEEECGEPRDEVEFTFSNFGSTPQSGFQISYQVNGGDIMMENYDATLAVGESATVIFQDPFNSAEFSEYTILAWTTAPGEQFFLNDTARYTLTAINSIPFIEDFEAGVLPTGWSVLDETVPVSEGHGAPSFVLTDNLWSVDPFFEATSPVFGLIETGDTLTFDYRYVNFGGAMNVEKTLSSGDSLVVFLSIDCGTTFEKVLKIDSTNHEPNVALVTQSIPLEDYVGESIKIKFIGYWGFGDYFLDIDNIQVLRCPATLGLTASVQDESRSGAGDGSITIDPQEGNNPFTYNWSNGASTKGIFMLAAGTYTVTVSDAFGCTDELDIEVGNTVNVQDIDGLEKLTLSPNPTRNQAILDIQFNQLTDVQISIFNAVGQRIFDLPTARIVDHQYVLDMSDYSGGLYFVQIYANGKMHTERLLYLKE